MYGSSQTCRVKGLHIFMYGCTSGRDVFIWKHKALSHPRVHGVFEVFRFKVELKFQSVFVHLLAALSFQSCVATAGGQGSCESS